MQRPAKTFGARISRRQRVNARLSLRLLAALSRSSRSIQALKSPGTSAEATADANLISQPWHTVQPAVMRAADQRCRRRAVGSPGGLADDIFDGRKESRGARGIEIQPLISALRCGAGVAERRVTRGRRHLNRMRAEPLVELFGSMRRLYDHGSAKPPTSQGSTQVLSPGPTHGPRFRHSGKSAS